MFPWYIHATLYKATYEIIDDPDPFYGEVLDLSGVWASGGPQAEDQKYSPERGSERSVISFQDPSPYFEAMFLLQSFFEALLPLT